METIEQVKSRLAELRQSKIFTNEQIDALNDAVWKLRNVDTSLAAQISVETLQYAERNQYERGRGYALLTAGWCQYLVNQYGKAKQTLIESQTIFVNLPDDDGLATVTTALATTKQRMGDLERVIEDYSFALSLREKKNDTAGVSNILNNLGIVCSLTGNYAEALDYRYRALPLAIQTEAFLTQAIIYTNLGNDLWRIGEVAEAIECLEQALTLSRRHSPLLNGGQTLVNLGDAHCAARRFSEALGYYRRGLEIVEQIDNFDTQADAHRGIGSVYIETGEWQPALTHLLQALQISQQIGNRHYESEALLHLGQAYQQLGDTAESIEALERALELSVNLGAKEISCKANLALSEVYESQNKVESALSHFQAFHRFWNEVYGLNATHQIQRLLLKQEISGRFSAKKLKLPLSLLSQNKTDETTLSSRDLPAALPPRKLQQITDFIQQHLEENIGLAECADVVSLSPSYFHRSFKHTTGKTPHQFLTEQRVGRAKQLLQTTNLPTSEIALRCGFSSQSHLSTHLRRLTGRSPKQFRHSE